MRKRGIVANFSLILPIAFSPNLTELQQDIQLVAFATLPQTVREQLINDPKGYFQQYAEDIVNPFKRNNLLSLEQDWLGFGRFGTANTTR